MRPGPVRGRLASCAALLLVLALASAGAAAEGSRALRTLIRPGEKAPSFALNDLDGNRVTFAGNSGKPSLIVFWSAFCPLCRELTPSISDIVRRHAGTLRVYSVNLDGKRFRNAVTSFVKEHRITYPVLLDDVRNDLFVASDPYGVEKTPTAVLVDGAGAVRAAHAADEMPGFLADFDKRLLELQKRPAAKK